MKSVLLLFFSLEKMEREKTDETSDFQLVRLRGKKTKTEVLWPYIYQICTICTTYYAAYKTHMYIFIFIEKNTPSDIA